MPRLLMMLMALVPLWLLGAAPADAGRSCTQRSLTERQMTQAIATATQLDQQLNHRSDDMVILARIGSDISEHGLKYTHAGLALRTEGGRWLVTHQLNECGTGRSMLRRQGLLQFLLDDPHAYDVLGSVDNYRAVMIAAARCQFAA